MIIEEIKKANIQAMKDKDQKARAIYSVIMNKHLMATVDARTNGKEVDDADMVRIIQKTIKELEEEIERIERENSQYDYDDNDYDDYRDDGVNWDYYNPNLDFDQQDPEFWD